MKTKFTIKAYLPLPLSIAFLYLIIIILPTFFISSEYEDKLFIKIFLPSIFIFSFVMLFFGEVRTKCIIVELYKNEIIVKKFFGLTSDTYKVSEIEGWKYSHLTSKSGTYEYLYLYKGDKKIIKISQFYHSNYFKIKNQIQADFKYLGYEKLSYYDEFKEIFK